MDASALAAPFMVGLLGSVHCVGMCGGIVAALSQVRPAASMRPFSVAVVTAAAGAGPVLASGPGAGLPLAAPTHAAPGSAALGQVARTLAYNTGRIGSYAAAGAIGAGAFGGVRTLAQAAAWQQGAYVVANLMLVALGLYLAGLWPGVARIEALGAPLWRRIQPLIARIGPMGTTPRMFMLGALWGWLPCGMVYSMLLTAMLAGSAPAGALTMVAFGLGTLPLLLAAGVMGARLRKALQQRSIRLAGGLLVLAFGMLGLARAWTGGHLGALQSLCIGGAA